MDAAHLELLHGQSRRQQDEADGNGQALAPGVEELLHPVEGHSGRRAQAQREDDFHHGLHQHRHHADGSALQSHGHAEGGGKEDQAHRVVNGHHHQKQPGQGAVGLVLPDHHQRGGGGRGGGNGAQGNGGGNGDDLRPDQVQEDQGQVNQHSGNHRLENAHHDRLPAHGFQLADPELVADGKGDEAQRHLGENIQAFHRLHGGEAQAADLQRSQAEGAQQQSRDQIGGDGGQLQPFGRPGQQQPPDQGGGKTDENFHSLLPRFGFPISHVHMMK